MVLELWDGSIKNPLGLIILKTLRLVEKCTGHKICFIFTYSAQNTFYDDKNLASYTHDVQPHT
jgi:hypothetical protein